MPSKSHLFTVTYWLLQAALAFSLFVVVVLVLALGAIFAAATGLDGGQLGIPAILDDGIARADALRIGAIAITGGLLIFAVILLVLRAARDILKTALSGDPFVSDNADRLSRIGALLIVLFAIELATNVTVNGMIKKLADAHHVLPSAIGSSNLGPDLSPIGLFVILLVFVLAQIFRRGSEMRAELEGTV